MTTFGRVLGLGRRHYNLQSSIIAGYFIVRRQWRPLMYMALGLVFIGAMTVAAMGLPLCLNFLRGMHLAMTATSDSANLGIRGLILRSFANVFGDRLDSHIEILQRISVLSAQVAILGLTAWPSLRTTRQPGFDQRAYGLWVAATVVLSPLSWLHYMVLLLIPLIAIAGESARRQCSRRASYAAAISYLLVAVTVHLRENSVGMDLWVHGVRYLAEGSSVVLLIGFLAAYWFAADPVGWVDGEKSCDVPPRREVQIAWRAGP